MMGGTNPLLLQLPHDPKPVCGISDVGIITETRGGTHEFGLAVVGAPTQPPQPALAGGPCRAVLRRTAVIVVPAVFHPLRDVAGSVVEAECIGLIRTNRGCLLARARVAF